MAAHGSSGRVVTAGAMGLRPTSGCTGRRASTLFHSFEHFRVLLILALLAHGSHGWEWRPVFKTARIYSATNPTEGIVLLMPAVHSQ